jgi:hypothetical protein
MDNPGKRPRDFLDSVHSVRETYVLFRHCVRTGTFYFAGLSTYKRSTHHVGITFDTLSSLPTVRVQAHVQPFYTSSDGSDYIQACNSHGRDCTSKVYFMSQSEAYQLRRQIEEEERRAFGLLKAKIKWAQ